MHMEGSGGSEHNNMRPVGPIPLFDPPLYLPILSRGSIFELPSSEIKAGRLQVMGAFLPSSLMTLPVAVGRSKIVACNTFSFKFLRHRS